jgi:hypothetical protein
MTADANRSFSFDTPTALLCEQRSDLYRNATYYPTKRPERTAVVYLTGFRPRARFRLGLWDACPVAPTCERVTLQRGQASYKPRGRKPRRTPPRSGAANAKISF